MTFWENLYGTVPYAALEDKAFRRDVLKWHDEYSADHPREADNRVTILARVLAWAAKDGPLDRHVLDSFDRAYHGDRSKIWLPERVDAFLDVASEEMQLAMILALHTGQRQGDIRKMAWSNYNGTHIRLRQNKSRRNGEEAPLMPIPCTTALKATLDGLPRRSTLILTTKTGRAFQKRYLAEQWTKTCAAAKITVDGEEKSLADLDLHFHDLRGTAITMMFTAVCHINEIVAVTGHNLPRAHEILDKYLARTSTTADRAIAKFENVLETDFAKRSAKRKG